MRHLGVLRLNNAVLRGDRTLQGGVMQGCRGIVPPVYIEEQSSGSSKRVKILWITTSCDKHWTVLAWAAAAGAEAAIDNNGRRPNNI